MMSLAGQTYAFLMTILAGAVAGLLFDLYRVLRSAFQPKQFLTALTDLLYWIVVTPIVFAMLLAGNWGELRFYVLIGLGLGLLLYFQTLSSVVIWAFAGALRGMGHFLGAVLFGLVRVICYPFYAVKEALGLGSRRWGMGRGAFGSPLGRPVFARSMRPARMAWHRFSWSRLFHRGG